MKNKRLRELVICIAASLLTLPVFAWESSPQLSSPKIKTIWVLGNSILHSTPDPNPAGEWHGDWGMAATARDSDYLHRVIKLIHSRSPETIIKHRSISDFEREFPRYDLSNYDSLRNADMYIIRISENVNQQWVADSNFYHHYDRLIQYLAPNKNQIRIIVDGTWRCPANEAIHRYAKDMGYPLVITEDLRDDPTNTSEGQYRNIAIGYHPSDKGMRYITSRIWDCISIYFPEK